MKTYDPTYLRAVVAGFAFCGYELTAILRLPLGFVLGTEGRRYVARHRLYLGWDCPRGDCWMRSEWDLGLFWG